MRATSTVCVTDPLVSTAFLDRPPGGYQETRAELWGVLPAPNSGEEWCQTAGATAEEAEGEEETREPTIHEGLVLDGLSGVTIASVAVGSGHVVFLTEGGSAFAYGQNDRGQLGVADSGDRAQPEKVVFGGCLAPEPSVFGVPVFNLDEPVQGASVNSGQSGAEAWVIGAVACGSEHTLFLAHRSSGPSTVFACGAWEALGLDGVGEDQSIALGNRQVFGATAIAARKGSSCCAAPAKAEEGVGAVGGEELLYFWGQVDCCCMPNYYAVPTALYRIPNQVQALQLGGFFGLALDETGSVFAWGDGTYGELGGAPDVRTDIFGDPGSELPPSELPVPGCVELPTENDAVEQRPAQPVTSSELLLHETGAEDSTNVQAEEESDAEHVRRVLDIACGERHSLLLDNHGHIFSFGENLAGQCGVPEVVGAGHITGNVVPKPRLVPMDGPRRCSTGPRVGPPRPYELGARVFAGSQHSAMVTRDHRLYLWGHPGNRKLSHAGFNPDGTEAGERPSKKRPPGVAVRSALRDAVRRPRFVYSLLHRRVRALGLGEECTIIVTGDGGGFEDNVENEAEPQVADENAGGDEFVVPLSPEPFIATL